MKRKLAFLICTFVLWTGCGEKGPSEEAKKEANEFLHKVTADTEELLKKGMVLHQRFLEVRNESVKTSIRGPLPTLNGWTEDTDNPTTARVFFDREEDARFPAQYRELSYWKEPSLMFSHVEWVRILNAEIENNQFSSWEYQSDIESLNQAANDLQYVLIVDGKTTPPVVKTDEVTGRKGFLPGFYSGTAYLFEFAGAKYLGQFSVVANSNSSVIVGSHEWDQRAVDSDLEGNVNSVIFKELEALRSSE
jgi:hypothetical protein